MAFFFGNVSITFQIYIQYVCGRERYCARCRSSMPYIIHFHVSHGNDCQFNWHLGYFLFFYFIWLNVTVLLIRCHTCRMDDEKKCSLLKIEALDMYICSIGTELSDKPAFYQDKKIGRFMSYSQ